MSRIKVDALQGTSGSDTAITLSGANATVGGTLAVTGVHTVGTNAVATSDGGGVTTSIVQGLGKIWTNFNQASIADSLNTSSMTDHTTGDYGTAYTNLMGNANYALGSHTGTAGQNVVTNRSDSNGYSYQGTGVNRYGNRNTSDQNWNDFNLITVVVMGDLA